MSEKGRPGWVVFAAILMFPGIALHNADEGAAHILVPAQAQDDDRPPGSKRRGQDLLQGIGGRKEDGAINAQQGDAIAGQFVRWALFPEQAILLGRELHNADVDGRVVNEKEEGEDNAREHSHLHGQEQREHEG